MSAICRGIILLLIALFSGKSNSESLNDMLDMSISARTDWWSGSRLLDDKGSIYTSSIWIRGNLNLGQMGSTVVFDGSLQSKGADVSIDTGTRVRELFWRYDMGPLRVNIGRQLTVWGKADAVNPTDNLTGHDFTVLVGDFNDARLGRNSIVVSGGDASNGYVFWWSPQPTGNIIKLPTNPLLQYRFPVRRNVSDFGLKWEYSSQGMDLSVSYFSGHDLWPSFSLTEVRPDGVTVDAHYGRLNIFGADFSLSRGPIVWKGEISLTRTESDFNYDLRHKKSQAQAVLGLDFSFKKVSISAQTIFHRVFDFENPSNYISTPSEVTPKIAMLNQIINNQTSASSVGLTLRVSRRWLNNNFGSELNFITYKLGDQCLIQSKFDYAINDRWSLNFGFERFYGRANTFLGALRSNSVSYFQLRLGF